MREPPVRLGFGLGLVEVVERFVCVLVLGRQIDEVAPERFDAPRVRGRLTATRRDAQACWAPFWR